MTFVFTKAKRRAVPLLISLAGVSGSGKTYSALLLAAGLAGKDRVGFLDTENGRGAMYADSPGIIKALPNGYEIADMREPFAPSRFTEAAADSEKAGIKVLVIDSMTHQYEGIGGLEEIAATSKRSWLDAKIQHKRMMNRLLSCNMHIIFCLRAREKVKVIGKGKEQQHIPQGIQPIAEKNFVFDMMLSAMLGEDHKPIFTKLPEPLEPFFRSESPLITREMGVKLREWSDGGAAQTEMTAEALIERAASYAALGTDAYAEHFKGLTMAQRKLVLPEHENNKAFAKSVDERRQREPGDGSEEPEVAGVGMETASV